MPRELGAGSLESMSAADSIPVVEEVLRFEYFPLGSRGTRRAVVRWSNGSEGEALTWYDDLCGHPHKSSYADPPVMQSAGPENRPGDSGGSAASA
jgi:hypothetical protein